VRGQTIGLLIRNSHIFLSLDGMAFWPADSRENPPIASKHSRKKVKHARCEYPFVTEGSLTATTLVNRHGKFEWTHVLQDKGRLIPTCGQIHHRQPSQGLRVHSRGNSTQIFPITRSPDPWTWKKSPAKYPEASVREGSEASCVYTHRP